VPIVFVLLLPVLVPSAQEVPKTTPAAKETGEPEGDAFHFQPMKVDQRIFAFDHGWFSELARRIEDGTATLIERRAFYLLDDRLYPYDKPVPPDWRMRAKEAERCLRPEFQTMATEGAAAKNPAPMVAYTWSSLGPSALNYGSDVVSGRATALWVNPSNKNIILLGTADGGLFKTTDQGTTWAPLFDATASLSIGAIGVDPNNYQVIYAGTGEGNNSIDLIGGVGIYKSSDGGATWALLSLPAWTYGQPYHNVRRIVVDPRDSQKVYAAVDGGLLYSTDAGGTWTKTTCGAAAGTTIGTDVVLDSVTPGAGLPSLVYVAFGYHHASVANGIYRSAGGGAGPWTTISASGNGFPTANVGRITLVQAPSDKKRMYALIQSTATYQSLGIYYCADATAATPAWTLKNSSTQYCSSQCWYDMHGCVDPANAAKLVVGGLDDYISTNSGATLTQVSCWYCSGTTFSHADHHFLFMPDSTTLYDANDGGFFIGTVSGTSVSWVNKNAGLNTLQFYGLAQHPSDATLYQGGLQDNGQAYYDGASWNEVAGGDGGWSQWDQANPLYAYEEYVYANISRNSNMQGTPSDWTCITNFGGCTSCDGCNPDNRTSFIAPFALDPNNPNTMYTGTYRLYANNNVRAGTTWTNPNTADLTNGGSAYIKFIHAAKNNGVSGTIYVGTSDGKVQVTSNSGVNWTDRSVGLPGSRVLSITTDPANANKVLVALSGWDGNRVYRSTDGGATWTNISGALPQIPADSVALDLTNTNIAYVGMDMGVYMNADVWNTTTWTSVTGNLPPAANFQLEMSPANHKLRTATHGRGVWELTISSPTPKEASPFHDMTATRGSGTAVNVAYTAACGATDNTVYAGDLSTLQTNGISWTSRYCNKLNTGSLSFDPGAANVYFVVVANNGSVEGSYGQGTSGERPAAGAGVPCAYTQNLAGTCP
jgi:hypothetical protein